MKIKILTTLIGLLFALNGMASERKLFDDHWRFDLQLILENEEKSKLVQTD